MQPCQVFVSSFPTQTQTNPCYLTSINSHITPQINLNGTIINSIYPVSHQTRDAFPSQPRFIIQPTATINSSSSFIPNVNTPIIAHTDLAAVIYARPSANIVSNNVTNLSTVSAAPAMVVMSPVLMPPLPQPIVSSQLMGNFYDNAPNAVSTAVVPNLTISSHSVSPIDPIQPNNNNNNRRHSSTLPLAKPKTMKFGEYRTKYEPFLEQCYHPNIDTITAWICPHNDCIGKPKTNCRFRTKQLLGKHYRRHTEFAFKCNICNKAFGRKTNLEDHSRVHSGEKPFKCELCQQTFQQKHSLNQHLRGHNGDKPFECTQCRKKFTAKHNMKIHVQTCHNESRALYGCELCAKVYRSKSALKHHERNKHM